jgi:polyphosphate kinase 2 (PPK2 family)
MLETIDLNLRLARKEYSQSLDRLQNRIHLLGFQVYTQKRPVVIVFEGWDAAGKGGIIKRLTAKLDPRGYSVWPISAPQGDEKKRHYLYRFWKRLPAKGEIVIFDRSWYGRVLVERVEQFCSKEEWNRAYGEIAQFERQLTDFGTILMKFWIHITQEEQLKRFQERERTNYKSWKLTQEDWRNRGKWDDYQQAAEDMLVKTSTQNAPWDIIEANDKWYGRIKVLKNVAKKLKDELRS